jgi:putative hydrolase of the HAD superfamily
LIIFDLDDTLIDTSGAITPFKMETCLDFLIAEGLSVGDKKSAYQELLEYNQKAAKSKEALDAFVLAKKGSLNLAKKAAELLTTPLPADFRVPTTPEALQIVAEFAKRCPVALVTGGHPPFQMEKFEKAGLDRGFFSKIAVPEDSKKKPHYEALLKEFNLSPQEAWVCGDRIEMDLRPAYELGMRTVHMRWGRGTKLQTEKWVDYPIEHLSQLKGIIR